MKHHKNVFLSLSLIASIVLLGAIQVVVAQDREFLSKDDIERAKAASKNPQNPSKMPAAAPMPAVLGCTGAISQVVDVAFEGLKFTPANYFTLPGGGEGGGFDKTPVLSTKVKLGGGCLNAHFSAIVGGKQSYGVAPLALFQVTLSPVNGGPRHMVGHYEQPYGGNNGAAVAIEAERDVDMLAANFFQKVGKGPHEVPPGTYQVDVWWAGNGPGGALAMDFVLKLYFK
jgi:hypothetical protein